MKRLLLLGGGHAHIEVLRDLAAMPERDLQVTLVTPSHRMIYTGMVPGVIAGHYTFPECTIDLTQLAQRANVELLLTTASLVSPDAGKVACSDGTVPKSVTTPSLVSTLISRAGVSELAIKRSFAALVIHMSRAADPSSAFAAS